MSAGHAPGGAGVRALDRAVEALAALAGALLTLVALALCVDVAVRYAQVVNINWIGDAASVSLYLIAFLAAPWVLREGGHIAIDSVTRTLPPGARRRVDICVNLLGALICAVLLVYAVRVLVASHEAGTQVFKMLIYPQWWLYIPPPVTFGLMALLFVRRARGGG